MKAGLIRVSGMNPINCEVMLLAWSESHTRGATITLQLADPDDLEPFKRLTLAKKGMAGQRLAMAMVEIGDDERSIPVTIEIGKHGEWRSSATVPTDEQKGGELARLAGILSNDPQFWAWLCKHIDTSDPLATDPDIDDNEMPAMWIRRTCGIQSRRELDHNEAAAKIFHEQIRLPYLAYQKERGL